MNYSLMNYFFINTLMWVNLILKRQHLENVENFCRRLHPDRI